MTNLTNNKTTYITQNANQTQKIGEKVAKELKKGILVALYGDLGSGKTTFVQGFAKGLGIKGRIISPTFIIVRSYKLRKNYFYHIDLYRIDSASDISSIGLSEILNDKNNIVALEWAEKIKDYLPNERIDIQLTNLNDDKREIIITSYGKSNR